MSEGRFRVALKLLRLRELDADIDLRRDILCLEPFRPFISNSFDRWSRDSGSREKKVIRGSDSLMRFIGSSMIRAGACFAFVRFVAPLGCEAYLRFFDFECFAFFASWSDSTSCLGRPIGGLLVRELVGGSFTMPLPE